MQEVIIIFKLLFLVIQKFEAPKSKDRKVFERKVCFINLTGKYCDCRRRGDIIMHYLKNQSNVIFGPKFL